jgi:hypothetical protein
VVLAIFWHFSEVFPLQTSSITLVSCLHPSSQFFTSSIAPSERNGEDKQPLLSPGRAPFGGRIWDPSKRRGSQILAPLNSKNNLRSTRGQPRGLVAGSEPVLAPPEPIWISHTRSLSCEAVCNAVRDQIPNHFGRVTIFSPPPKTPAMLG